MGKLDYGPMEEPESCPICGAELDWIDCEMCGGQGGFDAWEEDPINFWPGEDWVVCEFCKGEGGYLGCPFAETHDQEPLWEEPIPEAK